MGTQSKSRYLKRAGVAAGVLWLLTSVTAQAWTVPEPERLEGPTSYETAAVISKTSTAAASTVYVATGEDYPDALATAPVAAKDGAPVLLVTKNTVPKATSTEIKRLKPSKIVIVGGKTVVSAQAEAALSKLVPAASISRYAGETRYETAIAVARLMDPETYNTVFLASGEGFRDALAAAPAAAHLESALLLTKKASTPATVMNELIRVKPAKIVVVGHRDAISDAQVSALKKKLPTTKIQRVGGVDRFATAVAVADYVWPYGAASVVLSTSDNFPDALAAGPAAAKVAAPVLFTKHDCHPKTTMTALKRHQPVLVSVVGGSNVAYGGGSVC